ncbi:hypothetical protein BJY01DRAFT_172509 [Aspergillus pseudoustus]|uniref:Uncharacterized protein n=1 Tax=Aspergillus pseudoustus TaxID=1810923 RepID=A0ABR4K3I9_9EURO
MTMSAFRVPVVRHPWLFYELKHRLTATRKASLKCLARILWPRLRSRQEERMVETIRKTKAFGIWLLMISAILTDARSPNMRLIFSAQTRAFSMTCAGRYRRKRRLMRTVNCGSNSKGTS